MVQESALGSREEQASFKDYIRVYIKIKPSMDAPLHCAPTLLLHGLDKRIPRAWTQLTRDASEWAHWDSLGLRASVRGDLWQTSRRASGLWVYPRCPLLVLERSWDGWDGLKNRLWGLKAGSGGSGWVGWSQAAGDRVSTALLGSQRVLVVGNGTPLAALFAVSGFY